MFILTKIMMAWYPMLVTMKIGSVRLRVPAGVDI
jgi:hypothetical protein